MCGGAGSACARFEPLSCGEITMTKKSANPAPRKMSRKGKQVDSQKTRTIRATIPEEIYQQIETLVSEGWFPSHEDIVNDALRRFVNSNRPELLEKHVWDD